MNTKLYKKVHTLATDLMKAAKKNDETAFNRLYEELKQLCYDNENDKVKNHPVQWETLADFCDDTDDALPIYQKALGYAEDINSHDFITSISYAMAIIYQQEGKTVQAIRSAKKADEHALKISDSDLQNDIKKLLKALS